MRSARAEAFDGGVPIVLEAFGRAFDLDARDEVLLIALACEYLSHPLWEQLKQLQGGVAGGLRRELLASLFRGRDALLTWLPNLEPGAPLLASGLVMSGGPDGQADVVASPHHIAAALLGQTVVDRHVLSCCELSEPDDALASVVLPPVTRERVNQLCSAFVKRGTASDLSARPWVVCISGPPGTGKSALVRGLAATFSRRLFRLDGLVLAEPAASHLRIAFRNAQFLGSALHLDHIDTLSATTPHLVGLTARLIDVYRGLVLLEVVDPERLPSQLAQRVRFALTLGHPGPGERTQLWEAALPQTLAVAGQLDLVELSTRFELSGRGIEAAVDWALQRAATRGHPAEVTAADLEAGAALAASLRHHPED